MTEVFARLTKEPFSLTPEEIKPLTLYQVKRLFFKEQEEQQSSGGRTGMSDREVFVKVYHKDRGYSMEETDRLWAEHQDRQKRLQEILRERQKANMRKPIDG